jgi:hypothetical protein
MMSERISEVAAKIEAAIFNPGALQATVALHRVLQSLPEFQEPKSPWVDGAPIGGAERLILQQTNGEVILCYRFHESNYGEGTIVAHMLIPPYVPPESELVRRVKALKSTNTSHVAVELVVALVQAYEKEKADGK